MVTIRLGATDVVVRISLPYCPLLIYRLIELFLGIAVPPEILARGSSALRAYNNALREGQTRVQRAPVMLIGQDRSGKTSLKRSLKGQLFNPNEESTVGIDADPSHFQVSTEVWKTGKKDQQTSLEAISYEHRAAKLIVGSLMEEKQTPGKRSSVSILKPLEPLLPIQSESSIFASGDSLESNRASASKLLQKPNVSKYDSKLPDVPRDPRKQDNQAASNIPEEIASLVERLLHKVQMAEDEKDIYSVLWDFGGQSVYYVTHPLFLTPRAIYILVCDLSSNPYDKANALVKQGMFKKVEDNYHLKTNLDYLDFWMTSVASLASENGKQSGSSNPVLLPEKLPPVFLVCTHADKPHGGVDPCTLASEIFDFLQNKPHKVHLFEHVFVVNNTKSGGESECPEVLRLRQEVLSVAKELPQMKEYIPIKWRHYEKTLQVMKEEGHHWISLGRAKEVASKVSKIDDDQEILTLLNFLHDQRILIHFDDTPELNKLVVLDPQWLIDVFKSVITVKQYDHEEREFKDLWWKLEKTGILEEKLLEHVWSDQKETFESLVAVMEKFSLMCLLPQSPDASSSKQYLVPSMLMSLPPHRIMKILKSAPIPSLFFRFESCQIPPGLFPRLVLQCYQWCLEEFPSQASPQLHHNFARFYISPDVGCSVVLLCHSSSVEVVLLSERENLDKFESKMSLSVEQNIGTIEVTVARAMRRQLLLLLESMKKEFCWLNNIRCEVSFLCPACSRGSTVNYCQTHRKEDCKQPECLHFWSESELINSPQTLICSKFPDVVETRIQVKLFEPWLILPDEKKTTVEAVEGFLPYMKAVQDRKEEKGEEPARALPYADLDAPLSQPWDKQGAVERRVEDLQLEQFSLENPEHQTKRKETAEEMAVVIPCAVKNPQLSRPCGTQDIVARPPEDLQLEQAFQTPEPETKRTDRGQAQTLALPCAVQNALESCDPKDVVVRLQKELQLENSFLENPVPQTKKMIRCLARNAKCSNRLDVVKHLRDITPAGTTGPLLHDNLDVQNIPLRQSIELSVHLCGGDEWMVVAERLGLTPAEIRFLERRCRNPFEVALAHSRNQQYLDVGQLYDVLVDCEFPRFADLL